MAKALTALAIEKAVSRGLRKTIQIGRPIKRYTFEKGREATGIDLEKVFWQILIAEFMFIVAKVVWHSYRMTTAVQNLAKNVETTYAKNVFGFAVAPFFGWIGIVVNYSKFLYDLFTPAVDEGILTEEELKEVTETTTADLLSDQLGKVGDMIFIQYFFFIVMLIPILILGYNFVKSRKKR